MRDLLGVSDDVEGLGQTSARTSPAVRQGIARSTEPTGVLAQRLSVSAETVRKWRKRGAPDGSIGVIKRSRLQSARTSEGSRDYSS
jgi:transposase-like protein